MTHDDEHDDHEHGDGDEHGHDHEHGHGHDHAHGHDPHEGVTPDDPRPRARALQSLLIEKGLVSTDAIDEAITAYEREIGPLNGARVVARAWTDDEFRERLLEDADEAIAEFDFDVGVQHIEVKENTGDVHNAVVCTLCSCYPWSLLGLPPTWYKTPAYRSRMVREPRSVLAEFGVDLDDGTEVRVWDSSSEIRYMVLPRRPSGTEGMDEEELREVVTRDAMIGVERLDREVAASD
ncbi:MAG: nitrile hydratase subunit alpha [Haloarculaceae archaeon]